MSTLPWRRCEHGVLENPRDKCGICDPDLSPDPKPYLLFRRMICEHGVNFRAQLCDECLRDQTAKQETNMTDMVNHPPHYTTGGIETIDFIEAKLSAEEFTGYCRGNAMKYLSRAGLKGPSDEDIRKAKWYLDRLTSDR